jgi:glycosyltransferase involved in cell wall biosynthesis
MGELNKIKITVVTPSFNQGQFLEATILSVLGQNYPGLEYIIMDGGSNDDSVSIIKKYGSQLTYWNTEKDNGQSHAINRGFARSTGDILLWLNSDDLLMPNVLAFIADTVRQNGDGIYFGNCIHFRESPLGLHCMGSDVVGSFNRQALEYTDYIIQPSSFWTRRVYEQVGPLDESLHFGFDWEWFLRAKKKGIQLSPLQKCLSMYRLHDSHKSGTGGVRRQNELLTIYGKYSPEAGQLFRMLMQEKIPSQGFRAKMVAKIFRLAGRPVSHSRLLKLTQSSKYKAFSTEQIEYTRYML